MPCFVLLLLLSSDNYQRFLERKIRDALNFEGTPIKMIFRGKSLRDVSRAAKRGAIGAATSGVLRTTMGTTGGEHTKRLRTSSSSGDTSSSGMTGGRKFAPDFKKEGRQRKDKRSRARQ